MKSDLLIIEDFLRLLSFFINHDHSSTLGSCSFYSIGSPTKWVGNMYAAVEKELFSDMWYSTKLYPWPSVVMCLHASAGKYDEMQRANDIKMSVPLKIHMKGIFFSYHFVGQK